MNEGQTCYERDETFCEDQMCLRTGCRLQNAKPPLTMSMFVTKDDLEAARAERRACGMGRIAMIVIPDGYTDDAEFAQDCGFELASTTKPPYPTDGADQQLASDWYTWGFQAGMDAERKYARQWLPMATAPRDGTPILGYSTEGVSYVCWHSKGSWVFFKNHRGDEWHFEPTHWMRLPMPEAWPSVMGKEQVDGSNPV